MPICRERTRAQRFATLSEECSDHARQHVAAAAGAERRSPGRVDQCASRRIGDDRARALQDDDGTAPPCEFASRSDPIMIHSGTGRSEESSRFTGMWSNHHDIRVFEKVQMANQMIEGISI